MGERDNFELTMNSINSCHLSGKESPALRQIVKDMQFPDEKGKLFVGGLSWDTTHTSMLRYFSRYGEVIDCVVMKNQLTGKSRGFGFVTFRDPNVVDVVLASGPHVLDGRQIDPKSCNPRHLNKGGKNAENSKKKIFIGGLPSNCTESQLEEYFKKYGKVQDVVIMYDQERQRSRGFGFLTFETEDSVDHVCNDHFVHINGKQVEIKKAEPRDSKIDGVPTTVPNTGAGLLQTGLLAGSPLSLPAHSLTVQGSAAAAAAAAAAAGGYGHGLPQAWSQPAQGLSLFTPVSPLLPLVVPAGAGGMAYSPTAWAQQPALVGSGSEPPVSWVQSPSSGTAQHYTGHTAPGQAYSPDFAGSAGLAAAGYTLPPTAVSPTAFAGGSQLAPAALPLQLADGNQSNKPGFAYATYTAHFGVMGNYAQEASSYGPSRAYGAELPTTSASAHISFAPNVTYSITPGMTPIQGGYDGSFAGATIAGGHGDAPHTSYIPQPGAYARMASSHMSAFHPYRR